MNRRDLIAHFDRLSEFTEPMIDRGIETHRKGLFAVKVLDREGRPIAGVPVRAKLARHEFKFGCALFLLDQFPDDRRNILYREKFADIFNYGVLPLYWDTLEPEEGHPRFDRNSENIYRRPALDLVRDFDVLESLDLHAVYDEANRYGVPEFRCELSAFHTSSTTS